jgi:hypothetical protein
METVLQHDKLKHFFFGFLIFLIVSLIFGNWVAISVVTLVAIAKEVYDKKSGTGQYELLDIVYSLAPGILLILKSIIC